jgi:hypothetical protein
MASDLWHTPRRPRNLVVRIVAGNPTRWQVRSAAGARRRLAAVFRQLILYSRRY